MCVCVCVCVCVLHFRQNCPREKKKLDVHINEYFVGFFLPVSIYLTSVSYGIIFSLFSCDNNYLIIFFVLVDLKSRMR